MKEKLIDIFETGFDRAVVLCDGCEVSNVETLKLEDAYKKKILKFEDVHSLVKV